MYTFLWFVWFSVQFILLYSKRRDVRKMSNSSLTSILMHHHFTSLVWVQRLDHSHHDILVGKRKRNNGLNPSINGEEMLHTNWNAKIYEEVLQCFWGLVSCCWPQENEPHYKWTSAPLMSLSLSCLSGNENER